MFCNERAVEKHGGETLRVVCRACAVLTARDRDKYSYKLDKSSSYSALGRGYARAAMESQYLGMDHLWTAVDSCGRQLYVYDGGVGGPPPIKAWRHML